MSDLCLIRARRLHRVNDRARAGSIAAGVIGKGEGRSFVLDGWRKGPDVAL